MCYTGMCAMVWPSILGRGAPPHISRGAPPHSGKEREMYGFMIVGNLGIILGKDGILCYGSSMEMLDLYWELYLAERDSA